MKIVKYEAYAGGKTIYRSTVVEDEATPEYIERRIQGDVVESIQYTIEDYREGSKSLQS